MKQKISTSGQPFFGPHYAPETFGAGLRPDPLGELTAFPQTP
jgi:hypothetical protein